MPVYHFTKQPHSHTLNMYQSDDTLGHTLIPNTQAFYIWSYGDTVKLNTDRRGFRIGSDSSSSENMGILFFGDSFTLCEELNTKQAYPYLLGDALCQPVYNTAVSGYGYPQMILKAREHVAAVDPNVVVFQVSPWLADRAITPYLPAIFFKVPSPYYNQLGDIVPPLYSSLVFDLTQDGKMQYYRESEPSFTDKFGFVWKFTRRIFQQQYWDEFKLWFRPNDQEHASLADADSATELAINEMVALCEGRTLVFLVLGYNQDKITEFQEKYSNRIAPNVIVVNADAVLWSQPNIDSKESHEKAYCFWHGDPPVIEDYHYNAHANQLIMQALTGALQVHNNCITQLQ